MPSPFAHAARAVDVVDHRLIEQQDIRVDRVEPFGKRPARGIVDLEKEHRDGERSIVAHVRLQREPPGRQPNTRASRGMCDASRSAIAAYDVRSVALRASSASARTPPRQPSTSSAIAPIRTMRRGDCTAILNPFAAVRAIQGHIAAR